MTAASQPGLDLSVNVERSASNHGHVRVLLTGELDAWTGPTLREALIDLCRPADTLARRRGSIVLELRDLNFLDSSGLAALIDCRQELLDAGWVVTAGPAQPQICRVLGYADQLGWLPAGLLMVEAC
jgi:anti-sigma B factor antagonist